MLAQTIWGIATSGVIIDHLSAKRSGTINMSTAREKGVMAPAGKGHNGENGKNECGSRNSEAHDGQKGLREWTR